MPAGDWRPSPHYLPAGLPPVTQYIPSLVQELEGGGLLIGGTLLTPEDAVRMLIRAMGCDPKEERYRDVPARVVRSLRRVKRGMAPDPEEAIRGQIDRILAEVEA
jgi:GTP cyclohydrolase I